jgi:hypothetical protein
VCQPYNPAAAPAYRRMKSSEHLDKHWKQLHAREHSKRARAPPKIAKKYLASDKANRYRLVPGSVCLECV